MNSGKRVLIISSPYQHPSRESFLNKFTRITSNVFNDVTVIGNNSVPELENVSREELPVYEGNNTVVRWLFFIYYQIKIFKIYLELGKYDEVIIRTPPFVLCTLLFRTQGLRVSVFVAQKQPGLLHKILTVINIHMSNIVLCETEHTLRQWPTVDSLVNIRDATVYVDTEKFKKNKPMKDRNFVGYLGTLNKRKGFHIVAECCRTNETKAFLIGGGGNLEDLASELDTARNNVKYCGFVPEEELSDFYNSLLMLLLPTRSEGIPNVILEAMACGTPVVTTAKGGIPAVITDRENGFLLDDRDATELSQKINDIVESEELDTISENALNTIKRHYTYDCAIQRYIQIYG